MSNPKLRGVVHLIEETKTFGQKGFRKRTVVLEQTSGRFTNFIPLEFTNEGCELVDDLRLGDEIDVTYRLTGRKWQKDPSSEVKFFLSAEALAFSKVGAGGRSDAFDEDEINSEFSQAGADDDAPF